MIGSEAIYRDSRFGFQGSGGRLLVMVLWWFLLSLCGVVVLLSLCQVSILLLQGCDDLLRCLVLLCLPSHLLLKVGDRVTQF